MATLIMGKEFETSVEEKLDDVHVVYRNDTAETLAIPGIVNPHYEPAMIIKGTCLIDRCNVLYPTSPGARSK